MNKIIPIVFSLIYVFASALNNLYLTQSMGYRPRFKVEKFCVLTVLSSALCFILYRFSFGPHVVGTATVLASAYELLIYLKRRIKLKFTARVARLVAVYVLVITPLVVFGGVFTAYVFMLSYVLLFVLNAVLNVFESRRNRAYAQKLIEPLRALNAERIVITGSYGKTGVKNVLKELLSAKYTVVTTEANYNTPLGIAKSVQNNIDIFRSKPEKPLIFIAEAGARRSGDVLEICNLIKPNYGIITGVSAQHIESFGSVVNVAKTKAELLEYIGADGVMSFNGLNPIVLKMSSYFKGKSIVVGRDLMLENVEISGEGTSFEIVGRCVKIPIKTRLLGRHNAVNIAIAAALAMELGIDGETVKEVCSELNPTPHRLEPLKAGDITVIDDSYNANVEGVKSAFEVVRAFKSRKVVYAQGIVECGRLKHKLNKEVGEMLSKTADVVILSGTNKRDILKGLKEGGYKGEVHIYKNLMHAECDFKNILKTGDVLLLQNDIP